MKVIALFGLLVFRHASNDCIAGAGAVSFSRRLLLAVGVLLWSRCWDVLDWYAVVAVSDAGVSLATLVIVAVVGFILEIAVAGSRSGVLLLLAPLCFWPSALEVFPRSEYVAEVLSG